MKKIKKYDEDSPLPNEKFNSYYYFNLKFLMIFKVLPQYTIRAKI